MKRDTSNFFKSVSLRLDTGHPERFSHFHPTSKSTNVIRAIVHGDPNPASIVVASYGSGKSLAAGTAAMIVDNDPKARRQLKDMAMRLLPVKQELGLFAQKRAKSNMRGLPLLLEGHQDHLVNSLLRQAKEKIRYLRTLKDSTKDVIAALDMIAVRARKQQIDHIAIVWDEFGQHLEALAATGRTESLLTIQQLAEWVVRQQKPTASMTILLHQNLFQYAGNLSQVARSSWRKIEGRLGSIHYVEDSDEIYELIGSVVSELRPDCSLPDQKYFNGISKEATASGLFKSYSRQKELSKVLRDSYPLLPATLHSLPRMASRLAQNERTIFSFLREANLHDRISLRDIYLYFSSSMQADSGIGGSYRRWLETESALSKAPEPTDKEILSAAAMLGLGTSGERASVSKHSLKFAATGAIGLDKQAVNKAIDDLINRKLLLYRKNNDDISVWHGTDIDVRSRLQSMRESLEGHFDTIDFLQKEQTAPNWKPVKHNVTNSIRRYYQGRYVQVSGHNKLCKEHLALTLRPGDDGAIVYCLAENSKEISEATEFAKAYKGKHGTRLVFAIPKEPLSVSNLVSEILALRKLEGDTELLSADPFVLPELQNMIDAAQESLTLLLQRLVFPDGSSSTWISNGKTLSLHSDYDLQKLLSRYMDKWFGHTPFVHNELIVKHKVSRPMVNARKKLILGILERSENEHMGFKYEDMTPDVTLYRTVLLNSKLYQKQGDKWTWATPNFLEQDNPGLAKVWGTLKDFFTVPETGKKIADLFDILSSPPFGVRYGLMPIMLATSMKAFGRAFVIRQNGMYLPDILASQIEDICSSPQEYSVDVFMFDNTFEQHFSGLIELFSRERPAGIDLFREFYDTLISWRSRLPKPALTTRHVSKQAQALQQKLKGEIDPVETAYTHLPSVVGFDSLDMRCIQELSSLIHEIERIVDGYTTNAIKVIRSQLTISPTSHGTILQRAYEWATCFDGDKSLRDMFGSTSNAILFRSLEATNGKYSEASFARALSAILLGKNFEHWDDASSQLFADKLRDVVSSMEHTALMSLNPPRSLVPLVIGRINYYNEVHKKLSGATKIEKKQNVTAETIHAKRIKSGRV